MFTDMDRYLPWLLSKIKTGYTNCACVMIYFWKKNMYKRITIILEWNAPLSVATASECGKIWIFLSVCSNISTMNEVLRIPPSQVQKCLDILPLVSFKHFNTVHIDFSSHSPNKTTHAVTPTVTSLFPGHPGAYQVSPWKNNSWGSTFLCR